LSASDAIVLADFDNKTGDPVFDETLRQGLSVELQQSPLLTLIPDSQVQQTLALMGQSKEARLTPEIASKSASERAAPRFWKAPSRGLSANMLYLEDTFDLSRFAANPNVATDSHSGTGAYLSVRGQMEMVANPPGVAAQRAASMTEDPANRRLNGGGTQRYVLHLIPMSAPQILTTAGGPAVFHSDFSPVTAAKPARSGEVLIVQATGIGPALPGVDPGQPFPNDAILPVNSPIAMTVNGQDAEVVNGIGWPTLVDTYRVDFRVPGGIVPGTAAVQLSVAWIAGAAVRIPVQ
jgi:uncharacterized protein (TIGR03437 family)